MRVEEMSDLDLSYTPPLSSPWDPVQMSAQAWVSAKDAEGARNFDRGSERRMVVRKKTLFLAMGLNPLLRAPRGRRRRCRPLPVSSRAWWWATRARTTTEPPWRTLASGVYRQAVSSGGPILANPPQPLATATTDSAGRFTIQGLPAGRWFVLVLDQAGAGTWVPFDPATGAVVTLVVCTDCPIPL